MAYIYQMYLLKPKFLVFLVLFATPFFMLKMFIPKSKIGFENASTYFSDEETLNSSVKENEPFMENIDGAVVKRDILLFVGVLNNIKSAKRRNAVRTTWMTNCKKESSNVACMFFTDPTDLLSGENRTIVEHEYQENKDMVLMPYRGGNNFGIRLVWILKWATSHYNFDYFLRIDDDQFLCLDRLIYELPHRPKNSLYWGFIHCREDVVRVDEGWLLLSSNLVYEALSKLNTSLPCHPFGDQAVALWMLDSKFNVTYFYDNERIINAATAYKIKKYLRPDICEKYLSLHGSYPIFMKMHWNAVLERNRGIAHLSKHYDIPAIPRYEDKCKYSNKIFVVSKFWPAFRFDPKPCKDEPRWSNSNDDFQSREIYGEED